jgi:glycerol-3-phosphate dehydrogenase
VASRHLKPILILGAGINGAALARELVLHGRDVVVVDAEDIASGTTAYSSRLIHGGLRYLEYLDTHLVRESLDERARLLKLAPDFVRPLEFQIPVERRLGGFVDALGKLVLGGKYQAKSRRGEWLVRTGLWFYDLFAGKSLPKSRTETIAGRRREHFASRYSKLCTYHDGQMPYPEQFTVALLADAREAAAAARTHFEVLTYRDVALSGSAVVVTDRLGEAEPIRITPAAVVNASGPWGDLTLAGLKFNGKQLIGGTKGTHIVVFRNDLRAALTTEDCRGGSTQDAAIYAEAGDGRPVFILPFAATERNDGVLIGTTDLPYHGDPRDAVATDVELDYLIGLTNDVLPGIGIDRSDVALSYAGVRPLPHADASTPAAISRRHAVVEMPDAPWPAWTLVGGKLTTCRALAEEAAAIVLRKLELPTKPVSRERAIPQVIGAADDREAVRSVIRSLWVRRLEDLVERRLMLLFARNLSRAKLTKLADLLVEEGRLRAKDRDEAIERTVKRLRDHFGRTVDP